MRNARLVALAGLLAGALFLAGCCGCGNAKCWWDPCGGPDCAPLGDRADCCDACAF